MLFRCRAKLSVIFNPNVDESDIAHTRRMDLYLLLITVKVDYYWYLVLGEIKTFGTIYSTLENV